ncbi:MAG: hypothetical protein HW407_783 [Bacteroidetes bacterium]|nr:hypothetical protein [Bacteroidota bacterium]
MAIRSTSYFVFSLRLQQLPRWGNRDHCRAAKVTTRDVEEEIVDGLDAVLPKNGRPLRADAFEKSDGHRQRVWRRGRCAHDTSKIQ